MSLSMIDSTPRDNDKENMISNNMNVVRTKERNGRAHR